ncbi:hypothetical protein [Mobiluncus mulieris]|uniref:Uncharacterized protein n=1 Tax=Mobiluncus mulieris TaxID=2052 RepID=A0ABD4TVI2_9ACTO|nr:hypothetical protein [Mobiluncus mulieris]MCU9968252.1 hypothetical protein [Mobiluncus mulieris]MCU9972431.1 hypothetical protein [Mobiluncus mulieris]MCV0008521.1 hypothetical protein [Mobiluncus mulieris]MCV0010624.1 hypothetical protein [Mobiluncus mulieris]NMW74422.1 hypothetical protein [Mobiluncus mulieris]
MKARILKLMSGVTAALLLTLSVGVTTAFAGSSWQGQASNTPAIVRTMNYYGSPIFAPPSPAPSGKVKMITFNATFANVPAGKQVFGGICPVGYSERYCADITDKIYGAAAVGSVTLKDFGLSNLPASTSFFFVWGIADSADNLVSPNMVVNRQQMVVFYE